MDETKESFLVDAGKKEVVSGLPENHRPSRAELEKYRPEREWFTNPDLPHHGIRHTTEVLVWSEVLMNSLPEQVQAKIDKEAVRWAAVLHDSKRISDFEDPPKMLKHGNRAAQWVREEFAQLHPELSAETVERIAILCEKHTKTTADKRIEKADTRSLNELSQDEIELLIIRDADTLGMVRRYYSRKPESPKTTLFAKTLSLARYVHRRIPVLKVGSIDANLRMQQTRSLYQVADDLARKSRQDVAVDAQYKNDQFGAVMEAAERLKIIKS